MKILYGVVGEGMGHAMRSRVVLEHLVASGHDVEILASGRAVDYLGKRFEGVHRIQGLHIIYEENRVRMAKTVWSNVRGSLDGVPENIAAYFKLIERFEPDCVVSDFESWTYLYGKARGLPIFSVDNMQVLNRCRHDEAIYAGHEAAYEVARRFVKMKLPFCDHYFVTSFFPATVAKRRTTIVPPILRPEILRAKREAGGHLLVYQTAEGHDALAEVLAKTGLECRIYGMRRELKEDVVDGNLRYRPFSEAVFIADLASARGVVAGGGFTLLSECVYLHKPVLSVPVQGQFEQVLNARYLERAGFGVHADRAEDPGVVTAFVERLPELARNLARYMQDGNAVLFGLLDAELDKAAGGLYRRLRPRV